VRTLVTRLLTYPVENTVPRIIDLREPIMAAGMSMQTDTKRIYRDVPRLAKRYHDYKRSHDIPDCKTPWAFVAVSRGYDEEALTFTYAIGDVVTSFANLPSDLETLEIPAMTYAVVSVRPRSKFAWGFAIADVKRYVYRTWLPNSGYQQGRVIDDFEYHDERSTRKRQPQIDLYICLRRKDSPQSEGG
jgi:predicted transcriptional regulator YdeE